MFHYIFNLIPFKLSHCWLLLSCRLLSCRRLRLSLLRRLSLECGDWDDAQEVVAQMSGPVQLAIRPHAATVQRHHRDHGDQEDQGEANRQDHKVERHLY
jgi:hypothetical protein